MAFEIVPVGFVKNARREIKDDRWGEVISEIELAPEMEDDALVGLEAFSHVEVVFAFHKVSAERVVCGSRHPRGNTDWPRVGIFAQRGKSRPNRLGLTTAQIVRREGRTLVVSGLDAIDGTPVIDLKPVMREFLPKGEVKQPGWVEELMGSYWR